ncbi:HK97 gp10 family phage protein [Thermoclostridium stercorarium]|uniref:HK97 gp10 family phage protein n=1 Tax=Thermoclostridium stercorarium TaxID=1510 RepID=UPI002248EE0E|nr:HK97 gp10 family phage protein [Thermoclostridium stercorarium]UZQ86030.1 HK97 gp10 family phage protein [Thermoclostridium stercorarium]
MSSSNYRRNKAFIDKYRKELQAMLDDIREIDVRCLDKAVNVGLADAKRNTPIGQYSGGRVGGFMRKSWGVSPTRKTATSVEKELFNTADYAVYVNYGHRVVNRKGETVGWVPGKFILEKAVNKVEKELIRLFKKEVERVNRKHDK